MSTMSDYYFLSNFPASARDRRATKAYLLVLIEFSMFYNWVDVAPRRIQEIVEQLEDRLFGDFCQRWLRL